MGYFFGGPDPNVRPSTGTGHSEGAKIDIGQPDFQAPPTAEVERPELYVPAEPQGLTVRPPDYDVEETSFTVPISPTLELPDPPRLEVVNIFNQVRIPVPPEITIPRFSGVKPNMNIDPVAFGFHYVEPRYVSAMRDLVFNKIKDIMNGSLALPNGFWQQIVDRQNADQEKATLREVSTAQTEWGLRGWAVPSGPLSRAVNEARERGLIEEGKVRRDIFIQRSQLEVDTIKFAVQQGLAWETLNVQLFNAVQDRLLTVAKERLAADRAILDARIALFNVQKDFWVAEAQVHAQLIQAELSKLAIFKTQVEAEMLKVQIGDALTRKQEAEVRMYVAQVDAATKVVDVFRTQVEATRLITENNRTRVMAWAERVRAFESVVKAWSLEWEGYRAANDSNASKVQMYATEWDAFRTQVAAYSAVNDTVKIGVDAQIAKEQLKVSVLDAEVRKYAADVQGSIAEVEALASQARSNADYTRALTDLERVKVEAYRTDAIFGAEQARAIASSNTDNARIAAAEIAAQQDIAFKALDGQIRAIEQRIASALSGINVGANIQDSTQWGFGTTVRFGCDTSYNVSAQA